MTTDLNLPFETPSLAKEDEFQQWLNSNKPKSKRHRNTDSEYSEQARFVAWCRSHGDQRLHLIYSHLNGIVTHYNAAVKAKRSGALAGLPDLFLPVAIAPWHGLYIEMKRAKGGVVSPEQESRMVLLRQQGYRCVVANGCEEAKRTVMEYIYNSTPPLDTLSRGAEQSRGGA